MEVFKSNREIGERKGGFIMVMQRSNRNIQLERKKYKNRHKDYLHVKVKLHSTKIHVIKVCLSMNDSTRKENMGKKIEHQLNKLEGESVIIPGDFNWHIGVIGEHQLDTNGMMILRWLGKYGLIILNDDPECEGKITRSNDKHKSTIDYAVLTRKVYSYYKAVKIDEKKETFGMLFHNLIKK